MTVVKTCNHAACTRNVLTSRPMLRSHIMENLLLTNTSPKQNRGLHMLFQGDFFSG